MRVVFFGNSEGAFSNRHFEALLTLPCEIVGVVDVPPATRDQHQHSGRSDELHRDSQRPRHPGLRAGQPEHAGFHRGNAAS